jgi:hypothetical protein
MGLFQTAGVIASSLVAVAIAVSMARTPSRRAALLPWLGIWALAAAALAVPDATTRFARLLGIGRGADVVLYCAVLVGLFVAFRLSLAQRRIERQMTVLVREVALRDARAPKGPAAS